MTDTCYHCGEPVPEAITLTVSMDDKEMPMCCHGCQAVAQTIVDYGLSDYYRFRSGMPGRPDEIVPEMLRNFTVYDDVRVQESFVETRDGGLREAHLMLEGIVCPACIWLTESRLNKTPGVISTKINYTTNRASIRWDDSRIHLSEILRTITSLGFFACPYDPGAREVLLEKERKGQLRRIGLSGVLGMQVMMISVALYVGEWHGMEADFRFFLQWVNLLLTTPVVLYSAQPFYKGALRDSRHLHFGMDIPVSLGILIAYLGSIEATLFQHGYIYYDSIVMFVFLLLLARYLEFTARKHAGDQVNLFGRIIPATATRINSNQTSEECVPVTDLVTGDCIVVRPGETIPADAVITKGVSTVDESIITGESMPVIKQTGDGVIGGSTNIDSPIWLEITRIGNDSTVSRIGRLLEEAQNEKPVMIQLANRIASWFVGVLLLLAAVVAWYWWQAGSGSWLSITISLLVVSCPCALSLAAPTAITAASVALMRRGIAVTTHEAVENLARATHFIFDKTGTLTFGKLQLIDVECLADVKKQECIHLAAAIEKHSEHPVALAITGMAEGTVMTASEVINTPGQGITGIIANKRYFLGTAGYIFANTTLVSRYAGNKNVTSESSSSAFLADENNILCRFVFSDQIRPSARALVAALNANGAHTLMLSGDHADIVRHIAGQLGIKEAFSGLPPERKLSILKDLHDNGAFTAVIGDGINDAPILAAAHVSIAMGKGADIARISADMILLNDKLDMLQDGIQIARKSLTIIRQNMVWAIVYNLLVVPAAASGLLAPWMAAIGMSLSSLVVVGNAASIVKS